MVDQPFAFFTWQEQRAFCGPLLPTSVLGSIVMESSADRCTLDRNFETLQNLPFPPYSYRFPPDSVFRQPYARIRDQ